MCTFPNAQLHRCTIARLHNHMGGRTMADRSQYLQEMVNLVGRLVEDGFSEDEIREMLAAPMAHLTGLGDVPYARGTCTECGAVHVAWSEYQLALMVRAPSRRCGKP